MDFPGHSLQDGESIYSDWFPRGGDDAIFRALFVDAEESGSPPTSVGSVTIDVFTKNSDDPGNGAAVSGAQMTVDGTTPALREQLVISTSGAGIKELLRYKLVCSGGWIRPLILPPVFFDSAQVA